MRSKSQQLNHATHCSTHNVYDDFLWQFNSKSYSYCVMLAYLGNNFFLKSQRTIQEEKEEINSMSLPRHLVPKSVPPIMYKNWKMYFLDYSTQNPSEGRGGAAGKTSEASVL